jgi:Ran GTPase-activating protein (RanGAP) involved in mRNA processing and transport
VEPECVRALVGSPNLGELTTLRLRSVAPGWAGVAAALAEAPHLAGLKSLVLWAGAVDDEGAAALAASSHLAGLDELDLQGNRIGPDGVQVLASASRLRFTRIELSNNLVGTAGVRLLANSAALGRLTHLGLGSVFYRQPCAARAAAVGELVGSPHATRLRELGLIRNRLRDAGALALATSPHLTNLAALHLQFNEITDAGSEALLRSPYLAGLRSIALHSNSLGRKQQARWRARLGGNAWL